MYLVIIFFLILKLLPYPPLPSLHPLLVSCSFSFTTNRKHKRKRKNTKNMKSDLCSSQILGLLHKDPALVCGWYTQCHVIEGNWFPLSQQLSFVSSFSGGVVRLCAHFASFMLVFFSALSSGRSCSRCHNLCRSRCASILLCTENAVSLKSPTTSGSYNPFLCLLHRSQSLEGRGVVNTPHSGLGTPESLSKHCTIVGLCVKYHLLQ